MIQVPKIPFSKAFGVRNHVFQLLANGSEILRDRPPRAVAEAYYSRMRGGHDGRASAVPNGKGRSIRILFVTSRFPYPPLKGDQVRSYHQLVELGKRHDVTLISLCEKDELESDTGDLDKICSKIVRIPYSRATGLFGALFMPVLKGWPVQVGLYHSRRLCRCVREHLSSGHFEIFHVQLSRLDPVVPASPGVPVVMDMVDTLSLNMRRRADQDGFLRGLFFRLEAWRLRALEARIVRRYDKVVVVSEADRAALGDSSNVHVIPNGVDAGRFRFGLEGRKPDSIVFSGNMSYFPNVDAAEWFAAKVLPLILEKRPQTEFVVAGANPHHRLRRIAEGNPAVVLTGFVPKMEDVLASMTIAVAPMRSGTGIQNKVIEAMASGLPVVASTFALGGLRVQDGRELLVARNEQEFADAVIGLLADPEKRMEIARHARAYVEREHSWQGSVEQLEDVFLKAVPG